MIAMYIDKGYLLRLVLNGHKIEDQNERRRHIDKIRRYLLSLLPDDCDPRIKYTVEVYAEVIAKTAIVDEILMLINELDRIISLNYRNKKI